MPGVGELTVFGGGFLAGVFVKSLGVKAAKEAGKRIGRAIGEVGGDAAAGVIRSLGERHTPDSWRRANFRALGREVERVASERGVRPKRLPLSFLYPLVDEASKVDDKSLRGMWAGLLVSGVRSGRDRRSAYLQAMRSLGRAEAKVLREIAQSLSAGLDRGRLAARMREVAALQALGLVEVSQMPFWHDGSLSSLDHARRVRGSAGGRGEPQLRATVTLSVFGAGFMDAVEGRKPGDGWGDRARRRTTLLLRAIRELVPKQPPGRPEEELAKEMVAVSPIPTSEDEVRHLLHGYSEAMDWLNRPGPGWHRKVPGKE